MKTLVITNATVLTTSRGERVMFSVNGYERSIMRSLDQIKADLRGSLLAYPGMDFTTTVYDKALTDVVRQLKGGTMTGDITYRKKGDKWEVGPDHPGITDGREYHEGQLIDVTEDNFWVDGFLSLEKSTKYEQIDANARATAEMNARLAGMLFGQPSTGATHSVEEPTPEDGEIPASAKEELGLE